MRVSAAGNDIRKSPYRWVIVGLLFLGWLLGGINRTVMSFAIIPIARELSLTAGRTGMVLSAFFLGYMFLQIPGGMMADRFGSRKVLLAVVVAWSVFTFLTGLATGLVGMLIIRVLFGLSEAPFGPSASKMISTTFDRKESARAAAFMISSSGVVAVVAPIFAASVLAALGWRNFFFILGGAGIAIIAVFFLFLKPSPRASGEIRSTSFGTMLKIPMVWSIMVANFAMYTLLWGLTTWMPSYLIRNFNMEMQTAGWLQSIPGVANLLGYIGSGFIIDRLSDRGNKIVASVVAASSTVALYAMYKGVLGVTATIITQSIVLLAVGYFVVYLQALQLKKLPPEVMGRTIGATNFIAQAGSFLAPLVMGFLAEAARGNIAAAFWYLFANGILLLIAVVSISTNVAGHLPGRNGPSAV